MGAAPRDNKAMKAKKVHDFFMGSPKNLLEYIVCPSGQPSGESDDFLS
jgi:hypothetical protein